MKGTITRCLAELIETRFGKDRWAEVLERAQLSNETCDTLRLPRADVPDMDAMQLFRSTCAVLGINEQQAADAFGEYWCCTYAPRLYKPLLRRFANAREMLLGMDQVHVEMTRSIPNARPPRFEYDWADDRTLRVTYKSTRNMLPMYMGLARGVGKFFGETLMVSKAGPNIAEIRFP